MGCSSITGSISHHIDIFLFIGYDPLSKSDEKLWADKIIQGCPSTCSTIRPDIPPPIVINNDWSLMLYNVREMFPCPMGCNKISFRAYH